jgi:hypothetical protein
MSPITITTAANITYSGLTYNTPVKVKYKHTGLRYVLNSKARGEKYTSNPEIANEWKSKGRKVLVKSGYYFIDRIAKPSIRDNGQPDWWYITNEGDYYIINRASKYWRRKHAELSQETLEGYL